MSEHFLEELHKSIIRENEGYSFLFRDDIYIPVYRQELKVTIRETVKLNLLEEKVLQLIDADVYHIDEISRILGLKRRLLETTIADLHVKNMITVSSERCTLLFLGRSALEELQAARKTQEILRNVYVDALMGRILQDVSGFQLVERGINNDNKLKANVMQNDLAVIRNQIPALNEVFSSEFKNNVNLNGNTQTEKELLTIDGIENTYVTFIRSTILVFVSSNGYDIDIQPLNKREEAVIALFKDEIVKQIRGKRFLRNHFKRMTINEYSLPIFEADDSIIGQLKNFYYAKKKSKKIAQKIRNAVFSERKLYYGEEESIIRELSSKAEDVTLIVDNIDDWAFNRQFTGKLSDYVGKARFHIVYAYSRDIKKAIDIIKKGITVTDYTQENQGQFVCWDFDGEIQVYGKPHSEIVIDRHTQCVVIDYYFSSQKKKAIT